MGKGPRILIIEDDASIREFLSEALQDEGYEVATYEDGLQALRSVEGFSPNLIILDFLMPVMDGTGFVHAYRAKHEPVPIVGISAAIDAKKRADELGLADC